MQIENMPMVRVLFEKTGRAKYTSHLDTMRTLTRALKRSGLPLWYTMGFNPHLYMTFALPIALGSESLCESVDLRLTKEIPHDKVADALNGSLPPGFRVVSVAEPVMDPGRIAWADYKVILNYEDVDIRDVARKWQVFLDQSTIDVTKKTKKGEKEMDIRPLVQVLKTTVTGTGLDLLLRLAAGNTVNIAPTLLLKAFYKWSNILPNGVKVQRTAILTEKLEIFQ